MTMLQEYNRIFMEAFSLTEEQLNAEVAMNKTADWDSVGHVQLITSIENVFDIMFDTEDILNFTSYEKGKEILKKYNVIL